MLDPVEIALEAQAERIGLLGAPSRTGPDGTRRARRQRQVERVLALLTSNDAASHIGGGAGMRAPDGEIRRQHP